MDPQAILSALISECRHLIDSGEIAYLQGQERLGRAVRQAEALSRAYSTMPTTQPTRHAGSFSEILWSDLPHERNKRLQAEAVGQEIIP